MYLAEDASEVERTMFFALKPWAAPHIEQERHIVAQLDQRLRASIARRAR
jgi:hypothetical protein